MNIIFNRQTRIKKQRKISFSLCQFSHPRNRTYAIIPLNTAQSSRIDSCSQKVIMINSFSHTLLGNDDNNDNNNDNNDSSDDDDDDNNDNNDDATGDDDDETTKEIVLTPGEKVVAATRLGMWLGIGAFASVCAYYIGKELFPTYVLAQNNHLRLIPIHQIALTSIL